MNRYDTIKTLRTSEGLEYRKNAIYPAVPLSIDDSYILSTGGDRYDTLAQKFYNDYSLWWIIASANRSQKASLIVEPGRQLRIPAAYQQAIRTYKLLND